MKDIGSLVSTQKVVRALLAVVAPNMILVGPNLKSSGVCLSCKFNVKPNLFLDKPEK